MEYWSVGVLGGSFAASLVIGHYVGADPCVRPKVVHGLKTVLPSYLLILVLFSSFLS